MAVPPSSGPTNRSRRKSTRAATPSARVASDHTPEPSGGVRWCTPVHRSVDGDVAAMGGQCPDHEDIEGDDQDCPEGVVGQPGEVHQDADPGDDDADRPRPHLPGEESDAGADGDEPDDEVDPSP